MTDAVGVRVTQNSDEKSLCTLGDEELGGGICSLNGKQHLICSFLLIEKGMVSLR